MELKSNNIGGRNFISKMNENRRLKESDYQQLIPLWF